MSIGREFEGRDLAEALQAAAQALGCPPDALSWQTVEGGRRGLFGLGARPIRIWVELPPREAARHEAEVAPPPAVVSPQQRAVEEMLVRMIRLMGFDLTVRSDAAGDGLRVELSGPDRRMLVHKDGELLSALQLLLNRMGLRSWPEVGRIHLECEGYRHQRDEEVTDLAREVAGVVARTGKSRVLHPMNPYERRLVHLAIRDYPGLTSHSEGTGFLKQITISRAEKPPAP